MCEALKELFADELEERLKRGVEIGLEQGLRALILDNIEEGIPVERICEKLQKRFGLTQEKAEEYIRKYNS